MSQTCANCWTTYSDVRDCACGQNGSVCLGCDGPVESGFGPLCDDCEAQADTVRTPPAWVDESGPVRVGNLATAYEQDWINSHGHQIGEEYDGMVANSDGTYTRVGPGKWRR